MGIRVVISLIWCIPRLCHTTSQRDEKGCHPHRSGTQPATSTADWSQPAPGPI
ncbi:hypothetical protein PR003_g29793 [Phytophthora rubi]|uniref:RxLR effector protein n=1 Tax=Phytophthora rubi TaxID=129364 RepID=A0A6A3H8H1_9STRA|nr:hypothetical protein PR002_g28676 [Phytophthora rubi]KAE8966098.1 hypothetical protein PR001_g28513 [Phytophthora rubi]KAE9273799.1 hypothetical protein PR003_g29793 [Phytophthora rubi]